MDTIATAPLRDLLTTLTSLTTLLSTSSSTTSYSSLPHLISALIKADDDITTTTLPALRQHQANHTRILALRARTARLRDEITALRKNYSEVDYAALTSLAARIARFSDVHVNGNVDDDIAQQKAALDAMARAEHRLGGGRQGFAEILQQKGTEKRSERGNRANEEYDITTIHSNNLDKERVQEPQQVKKKTLSLDFEDDEKI
ncbi:hypothetical protein DV735_g3619, partial [Chaetothyriales sp. CBS 134920]